MSYKVKFISYLFCLINYHQEASENTVKALVNKDWLNKKEQNDFLLVSLNKTGNIYENTEKKIKIEIEEKVKINTIKGVDKEIKQEFKKNILKHSEGNNDLLQINLQKYALFEIKIKKNIKEETIYLYCSDIESTTNNGMFENCNSIENVSVIIGDGKNIKNISKMFYNCNNLVSVSFEYLLVDIGELNCDQIFKGCKNLFHIDFVWKGGEYTPLYVYLKNKKEFNPWTCYDGVDNNCNRSIFRKYYPQDGVDSYISCCRLCCPCFI